MSGGPYPNTQSRRPCHRWCTPNLAVVQEGLAGALLGRLELVLREALLQVGHHLGKVQVVCRRHQVATLPHASNQLSVLASTRRATSRSLRTLDPAEGPTAPELSFRTRYIAWPRTCLNDSIPLGPGFPNHAVLLSDPCCTGGTANTLASGRSAARMCALAMSRTSTVQANTSLLDRPSMMSCQMGPGLGELPSAPVAPPGALLLASLSPADSSAT